ncbi:MAG TPA: ACT domain-containing protein, partial [Chthonomonadales bacterium]|nr:ACT domain-containing protein [Chthonomonadales bacterium]
LLADVGQVFSEIGTNITSVKTQSHPDRTATLQLAVEVRNTDHLLSIINKVRSVEDVLDIQRAMGWREEAKIRDRRAAGRS